MEILILLDSPPPYRRNHYDNTSNHNLLQLAGMPESWHSGYNLAGYMPDPDVVACSPTWQEAADYLTSTMTEYADADDEQTYADTFPENPSAAEEQAWWASDDVPVMRAVVDSVLQDDPPQPDKDYSVTIEDGRYRYVSFWLMKVLCDCEDFDQ